MLPANNGTLWLAQTQAAAEKLRIYRIDSVDILMAIPTPRLISISRIVTTTRAVLKK
jgi:hypothetical protein